MVLVIKVILHQEYALSPMLFVIIMEVVTEQLHEGLSTSGSTVCG